MSASRVAAVNALRGAARSLRPSSTAEAVGVWGGLLAALALAWGEHAGLLAAVRLARRGLDALPELVPTYLLERLLHGALAGTAALLVLGALTTAVSTLFLSEELAFRLTLPVPHRSLVVRQLVGTVAATSGPALFLALPVVAVVAQTSAAPVVAPIALLCVFLAVALSAGTAGCLLALLLVAVVPPRRARLLAAALSAAGLAVALVGARAARPERLFDPVALLDLLTQLGTTPPPPAGADPLRLAARAATLALTGEVAGLAVALGLLLVAIAALLAVASAVAPLHLRLIRRTREEPSDLGRTARDRRPATSLGRTLVSAEAATFLRDAATPGQLGTLAAVFVLDLLNLRLLPAADAASRDLVAGLQTGLALFLVSALSLRFAYPAVSGDGRAALVLRSLPLSPLRHLAARYVVRGVPAAGMALVLTAASGLVLGSDRESFVASLVVAAAGGLAIPALHLGLGALLPRYDATNPVTVALGPGGLVAMALSTLLAVSPIAVVSDGVRSLVEALSGWRLAPAPLLAAWLALALVLGGLPLALAARRLPRADVAGG